MDNNNKDKNEFEMFLTPMSVSYLDLMVFSGNFGDISEQTMSTVKDEDKVDELFSIPKLPDQQVYTLLYEMGVDTGRSVEEKYCYYRPKCLKTKAYESSPYIYGKVYFGYLREDNEFKLACAERGINL